MEYINAAGVVPPPNMNIITKDFNNTLNEIETDLILDNASLSLASKSNSTDVKR